MRQRVLVYSTAYYPYVSGAELAIKEIADRLAGEYEFDLVTARMHRRLPRVERMGAATVYRLGWGIPRLDKLYLAAFGYRLGLRLHRRQPYAAVWAMMASFGGFAAAAFKARTNVPFLLTLQEGDDPAYIARKTRLVRRRFGRIFSTADALQSISTYLQRWGHRMGFRGQLDEVVPNGVAIEKFVHPYTADEIRAARAELGFPAAATVLVTTSRLSLKNGLEDVIRSLPLLPPNVCFCICGVGELEAHLRAVVAVLGLEPRVRFLGFRDYLALPLLLQASDVFVRPSLSEGLGNSFLEAMSAGLVTIGTPVGGITDFLVDGVTGIICEPGNPASVAAAVRRAMELPPAERTALLARALARVRDGYDWDVVARRVGGLLGRLASL